MRKLSFSVLLVAVFIVSAAEAGVKVLTTWKDPRISAPNFTKIAIAFPTSDTSLRQRVESGLARRIPRSVAAYTIVPDELVGGDREAIKARLAANQVDGLVLLRLMDVKEESLVSFGETASVYPSVWDAWAMPINVNTATYATTLRTILADLAIFSVSTGKPIWIGRMKSTDPKYLKELLDDLVKAGSSELKKQKLIKS
jgi:hypothetical protein